MFKITIVVLALAAVAAGVVDHCNVYRNCASCVASPFCGWCSSPVVYQDGQKGYQCAGFNKDGHNPFVCNGIYSTETCIQGWVCDEDTYQCIKAAPGAGVPRSQCLSNCSTVGKTFVCDHASNTCKLAPAGEGTSFQECMENCSATHSPASHSPASHSPASHSPASHSPSSPSPATPGPTAAPTYVCNASTLQCVAAQPGHGAALSVCEETCKKTPVTPTLLKGLWRSFPLKGDQTMEYDLNFFPNNTVAIYGGAYSGRCNVFSIGEDNLWLEDCTAPSVPGTVKCIWQQSPTMPETFHAMMACTFGADAPASFKEAMQESGVAVQFMTQCVNDGYCKFHFGPSSSVSSSGMLSMLSRNEAPIHDPCMRYGANCSYCLAHEFCGWCSTNVIYSDGTVGTQCAGFNPDPRKKTAFMCSGSYSTEMCLPGWVCVPENQTCVPTTPGDGVPKQDCSTACKAQPGPPSQLIGNWRGLYIENGYPYGLLAVKVNASTIEVAFNGKHLFFGTLSHVGGEVFIKYIDGPHAGSTISGIYSSQENELVAYNEIAFGGANEDAPVNYKQGMRPPSIELVLARCTVSGCDF